MSEGFENAVLGGASKLIRVAIQSANYVAGVAGWRIAKDGTAEFNSATIRGSLIAGGGAVTLDATGLVITGASEIFSILQNQGFTATRNPADGALARLDVQTNGFGYGGTVTLNLTSPSSNGHTFDRGLVFSNLLQIGSNDIPHMTIHSPNVTGKTNASIDLQGQSSASSTDNSVATITADSFQVFAGTGWNIAANSVQYAIGNADAANGFPGWVAGASMVANGTGVTSATPVVQMTTLNSSAAAPTYLANSCYKVVINGNVQTTAVGAAPVIGLRKSGTGQVLGSWRIGPTVAGFPYGFCFTAYFQVGNANVSGSLEVTLAGAAAQTVTIIASATNVTTVDTYYESQASVHPNAPVLV